VSCAVVVASVVGTSDVTAVENSFSLKTVTVAAGNR